MPIALVRPDIIYGWKAPSLLIVNERGDISTDRPLAGFYYRETRCLNTLRLEINGRPPWLCEAAVLAPDMLTFAYAHPEIAEFGGGGTGQAGDSEPVDERGIPQRSLDLRVEYK